MSSLRHSTRTTSLAVIFAIALSFAAPQAALARGADGFDDQYVFAATKAVNDMPDVNPALKVTIYPVTVLLDVVFLPFAVIAGFVG